MKKKKKNSRFQKSTLVLLAVAVVLLAGSAIGSTRAALTYFSENYAAQMNTPKIGVALLENGEEVANDSDEEVANDSDEEVKSLLTGLTEDGAKFQLGREYKEELAVRNTGTIDQYVRVTIYKYWMTPETEEQESVKDTTLSPSYIDLQMAEGNGWIEDAGARTTERSVWYYTEPLAVGATTPALSDTIQIDNAVASKVSESTAMEDGKQVTTTVYAYDGYTFQVKAEVDAVQNHNAQAAIKSAWGVDAAMSGSTITSVE